MDLLLWRHAEAEAGFPDSERKLTPRGEKQAKQMAEWIRRHAPKNLRIISSPAVRCQQTAKTLGRPFETDIRLGVDHAASDVVATFAPAISDADERSNLLIIGHQPNLGRVAAKLLAGQEADWPMKKGALWWISMRTRGDEERTLLSAVIPPDML